MSWAIHFRIIHETENLVKIKFRMSTKSNERKKANTEIYVYDLTLHLQNAKINSHKNKQD